MKTYGEMEVYLHHSCGRHRMKAICQLHALTTVSPGKHPLLDRRLGDPRRQFERCGGEANLFPRSSNVQTVSEPTELSQL
jgi:hypothetical protein